ncbi:MAG: hypothetical protein GY711_11295, partial [bacterium]|nr:hypothetical protein [bacterium]
MVGRPTQESAVDHPTIPGEKVFGDGDPNSGALGTVVLAANLNTLTEELVKLAEAEGLIPDINDHTQVRAAIAGMIGRRQLLKNRAINGSFDVWQRQVSFAIGDLEAFTADRFAARADSLGGAGAATISRQAFAAGQVAVDGDPTYFLRVAQTTAASQAQPYLAHRVEGVRWTSQRTVTVSFWAMADQAFDIDLALMQDFGPGGSAAVSGGTETFSITAAWQRFSYTTQLPDVTGQSIVDGAHLELKCVLPQSIGFAFDIADVQVELGDVATPVDRRPFSLELALCQRFYEHSYPYGTYPGTVTEQGMAAGSD